MVPSVECGCEGGVEGGEMPQVQDAHHCPFELDMLDWYMPSESSQKWKATCHTCSEPVRKVSA